MGCRPDVRLMGASIGHPCGSCANMPTVARIGPYRLFYGNEGLEPAHIHVQHDRRLAKFWLGTVTLAWSKGFAAHELTRVEALVVENRERFLEAWRGFFDS